MSDPDQTPEQRQAAEAAERHPQANRKDYP